MRVLKSTTLPGLLSSCRQPLKVVTANEQLIVLPEVSVAVQVTEVVPTGNDEPEGGTQATVVPGQLSDTVPPATLGVVKVTTALVGVVEQVCGARAVIGAGQVMVGFWVSLTVTVKVQRTGLPFSSSAEQVTVVVPTRKVEPLAGEQVAVVVQFPVVVGAG